MSDNNVLTDEELPPLPEPDEKTRRGLAFSGFAVRQAQKDAAEKALNDCAKWCSQQAISDWYGKTAADMVRAYKLLTYLEANKN